MSLSHVYVCTTWYVCLPILRHTVVHAKTTPPPRSSKSSAADVIPPPNFPNVHPQSYGDLYSHSFLHCPTQNRISTAKVDTPPSLLLCFPPP
ncbi:hypothetical protein GGI42DRAFT_56259 [Trichoderma sp. SZMC 28013]